MPDNKPGLLSRAFDAVMDPIGGFIDRKMRETRQELGTEAGQLNTCDDLEGAYVKGKLPLREQHRLLKCDGIGTGPS